MVDTNFAAICGLFCRTCDHLGTKCGGCGNQKGKPFWTTSMNIESCPIYNCCINKKHLEHCGLCDELPCVTFLALRDPSLSEEEAEKVLAARKKDLLQRKQIGTKQWLAQKDTN